MTSVTTRRRWFGIILTIVCVGLLELLSLLVWIGPWLPDVRKENIIALCRPSDRFIPSKLPNTFWHHGLNPAHADYQGLLNKYGTKGASFEMPKPSGELRVVCLGNSTVEGIYLAPGATFPDYLQRLLHQQLVALGGQYQSVKVINAGVSSHNSAFNLSYLAFRLIHFQPDIVIIKSAYNDYVPYCLPGMGLDYTHAFPEPYHLNNSSRAYWHFARHSYFLKVLGMAMFKEEVFNPAQSFNGVMTEADFERMDFAANMEKLFIYEENIRSMLLLCKGRDIRPYVIDLPVQPNELRFGQKKAFFLRYKDFMARLQQCAEKVAQEESVTFISTAPLLLEEDFIDQCHNTAAGHRKIAGKIAGVIAQDWLNPAAQSLRVTSDGD